MNETSEELMFRCQECGEEFPADPDCMLEMTWGAEVLPEAEMDEDSLTADQLADAEPADLREMGITPEQRDLILRGETVQAGAFCCCKPCQDKLQAEQHP